MIKNIARSGNPGNDKIQMMDFKVVKSDPDLTILELGVNNQVGIPTASLFNLVNIHGATTDQFRLGKGNCMAVDNMTINSALGIDVWINAAKMLHFLAMPPIGKVTSNPAMMAFDKTGSVTVEGRVDDKIIIAHGGSLPVFGFVGIVTPYDSLSGMTTVTMNMINYTVTFQLNPGAGRGKFAVGSVIPVYNEVCTMPLTSVAGPPVVATLTPTLASTAFDKVFHFDPFTAIGHTDDYEITAINANISLFPLISDEAIRSAINELWMTNRLADFFSACLQKV